MSDDPVTRVLAKLSGVAGNKRGWHAKCPAHDDQHASLTVTAGRDGRVLLKCFAGCAFPAIVAALGLQSRDLFPPRERSAGAGAEAVYDYLDEQRQLLFQVVRFPGKQFRQRRPDGAGGWIWNVDGIRRVLYRLPELHGQRAVLAVEGEKDVETLRQHGLPATTNAGGAGKWREDHTRQLVAAGCHRVAILPDNDAPGLTHARMVARHCYDAGLLVKVLPLDGLSPGGDVSEYLRTHTRDDLRAAVRAAPPFDPQQPVAMPFALELISIGQLLGHHEDSVNWIVDQRIPSSGTVLAVAPPKVGKSTLARHLAYAIATGTPCLDWPTRQGTVWYLALEEARGPVQDAFARLGATGEEPIQFFFGQAPQDLLANLHARALIERPTLIIVDTLQRLIRTKDLNDYALVSAACDPLLTLCRETHAALLLLHHASAHHEREGVDAVLGSTALTGSVDNILILKRYPDKHRELSSVQRIGPDLDPVVVALDPTTGRLSLAGSQLEFITRQLERAILDALATDPTPQTETWIRQQIDARRQDQIRALRHLVHQGLVTRTGAGHRYNPYRYQRRTSGESIWFPHGPKTPIPPEPDGTADTTALNLDFAQNGQEPDDPADTTALNPDSSHLVPTPIDKSIGNQMTDRSRDPELSSAMSSEQKHEEELSPAAKPPQLPPEAETSAVRGHDLPPPSRVPGEDDE